MILSSFYLRINHRYLKKVSENLAQIKIFMYSSDNTPAMPLFACDYAHFGGFFIVRDLCL